MSLDWIPQSSDNLIVVMQKLQAWIAQSYQQTKQDHNIDSVFVVSAVFSKEKKASFHNVLANHGVAFSLLIL